MASRGDLVSHGQHFHCAGFKIANQQGLFNFTIIVYHSQVAKMSM